MADTTTRDKVWMYIVAQIRKGEAVTVQDVMERVGCSERTARSALEVATENAGLLKDRHGGHGKVTYRPTVTIEERDERA